MENSIQLEGSLRTGNTGFGCVTIPPAVLQSSRSHRGLGEPNLGRFRDYVFGDNPHQQAPGDKMHHVEDLIVMETSTASRERRATNAVAILSIVFEARLSIKQRDFEAT